MFRIAKQVLFFSFFICSSVCSMRHVAQALVVRTLGQSAPFRQSLLIRCPNFFMGAMEQVVEKVLEIEKTVEVQKSDVIKVAENKVPLTNRQDTVSSDVDHKASIDEQKIVYVKINGETYGVIVDPKTGKKYICFSLNSENHNLSEFDKDHAMNLVRRATNLHGASVASEHQLQSHSDSINERIVNKDKQSAQHRAQIAYNVQVKAAVKSIIATEKKQLSSEIAKSLSKVESIKFQFSDLFNFLKNHALCLNFELQNLKTQKIYKLSLLEQKLQSLLEKNYKVESFVHAASEMQYDIKKTMNLQDLYDLSQALTLQIEIQELKADIRAIDYKFEQNVNIFSNELQSKSVAAIEKEILLELKTKQEKLNDFTAQQEHQLQYLKKELNSINDRLKSLNNGWFGAKSWRWFSGDEIQKILVEKQQNLVAKIEGIKEELRLCNAQLQDIETKITQAQNVFVEKQIAEQESRLVEQKQGKDALSSYNSLIQSQHEVCTFDLENCPNSRLEKHWCDRQDALFQTIDQGYLQYDQSFNLDSQTCGFLAAHGIDYKNFQNFYGTALQQQLHQEMCNILSQAALLQTKFEHPSNLVSSIVDIADAAYDANQLGQIKTVTSLNNLNFSLLEYGQAVVTGTQLGLKGIAHTVSNLDQTAESVGKAVYYVLETVVLGNYTGSNDTCIQLREQRKAEIVVGLQNLGHAIANSTGPQKVQFLTQFLVDFGGTVKIAKVVGGVCGIAEFAAVKGTGYVKSEIDVAKSVQSVVAIASDGVESKKIASDVTKIAYNVESVGQEKIMQGLAEELRVAKVPKIVSSSPIRCKILTLSEVVTEIKKVGGKISVSNLGLFNNTQYWLEQICAKINTKIEGALLEQYNKMTQIVSNPKMSICMDLEHIVNVGYKLVKDGSGAYHTIQFTGGHLAGTMSKLAQQGLFEIKSFVEFGGGCIEYSVKDLLTGLEFTHTEFPAHWNVEKIAQETKCLVENAITNGSLTEKINKPILEMTNEGFKLKIVTNSAPKIHNCAAIENSINKHIVTSYPYKG